MGDDDSANSSAMRGYKSLKAFLAQHAAFFEAQGYRAKKTLLRLEFTRLSDGRTVKIPWPFDWIVQDVTPETYLNEIKNAIREADNYVSLRDFLAQHSAFFEVQGYRFKKTRLRLEFTRLSDGRAIKIMWPFDQVTRETTPETFLDGFRSMLSGGKDD